MRPEEGAWTAVGESPWPASRLDGRRKRATAVVLVVPVVFRVPLGRPGPNGPFVMQLGNVLARVTQELEDVQRTLRVQFTRIAQLQADLDEIHLSLSKVN